MLDLGSEEWTALNHAYGSAMGTPALLRRFDEELRRDAQWEEPLVLLSSSLLHQGDVSPALVAAVPHLVATIDASSDLRGRLSVWSIGANAARGLATVDRVGYGAVSAEMWSAFDAAIARARAAAMADALAPMDDVADGWRVTLVESVADLHGWHDLALAIRGLSEGELVATCAVCGVTYVDPGDLRASDGAERSARIDRGVVRARVGGSHVADEAPAELLAGLMSILFPVTLLGRGGLADLAERIFDLESTVPCWECEAPIALVSPTRFGG